MIDWACLYRELDDLCSFYKIPKRDRPHIERFDRMANCVGFYCDITNSLIIYTRQTQKEALKTLRHEFGHFILAYRDPKGRHIHAEERICKLMERTRLRFPHLTKTSQQPLDKFIKDDRA